MIKRILQNECKKLARQYPVITITGPRQSGKTTLARSCFPKKDYINLEEPDQRRFAIEDPKGFLSKLPQGAILDEIQRTPDLLSYIQSIVDATSKKGMFILTGSQQFELSQTINQSLAGRTALIKLLPFNLEELYRFKKQNSIDEILLKGFYPRLHNENLMPQQFYMGYFETYIQRDLRQLSQIDNLHTFEKFVRLIASRVGQLLNYNNIANDIGISQPTIRKWVSLLEASYIVYLLPPFYRNIKKRLIKTPKVYFYDTGLVSYLLEMENVKEVASHPLRGNLFENFIVIEFLKKRFNQVKPSNLYFYRDRTGNEIDLVISKASKLIPVEIKTSQTANTDFVNGIDHFRKLFPDETKTPAVIYTGEKKEIFKDVKFLPWSDLRNALSIE